MNSQDKQSSTRSFTAGVRASLIEQARYQNFMNDPNGPWVPVGGPEPADPIASPQQKPSKVKTEFDQQPER